MPFIPQSKVGIKSFPESRALVLPSPLALAIEPGTSATKEPVAPAATLAAAPTPVSRPAPVLAAAPSASSVRVPAPTSPSLPAAELAAPSPSAAAASVASMAASEQAGNSLYSALSHAASASFTRRRLPPPGSNESKIQSALDNIQKIQSSLNPTPIQQDLTEDLQTFIGGALSSPIDQNELKRHWNEMIEKVKRVSPSQGKFIAENILQPIRDVFVQSAPAAGGSKSKGGIRKTKKKTTSVKTKPTRKYKKRTTPLKKKGN